MPVDEAVMMATFPCMLISKYIFLSVNHQRGKIKIKGISMKAIFIVN